MNSAKSDTCDTEVQSHIDLFLAKLPESVQLERVLGLDLKDPQATLAALLEVRAAVLNEQRKARALYQLSTGNEVGFQSAVQSTVYTGNPQELLQ